MAKRGTSALSKGTDKRGGYSGSKPAEEMGPPVKIPSAASRLNGSRPKPTAARRSS